MKTDKERIAELEDRVAELEWRLDEILGAQKIAPKGVTRRRFEIAELLARRSPMAVTNTALHQVAVLNLMDAIDPDNILKAQVSTLRKWLKGHKIEISTVLGIGYAMTPENAAKWRALVAQYNPQLEDAA